MNSICECGGLLLRGQKMVLCVCGRECHRQCSEVIEGAYHGPTCQSLLQRGEKIQVQVPVGRL